MDKNTDLRQWFKKKRFIIPILLVATAFAYGYSSPVPTQTKIVTPIVNTQRPVTNPYQNTSDVSNRLSNDNYYTNTYGNQVHSPAYSNSAPVGATAQCGDGTYSFSQSRRGTCSHHGGVASWL